MNSRPSCSAQQLGLEFKVETLHPAFRRDPQSNFARVCAELTDSTPRTVAYGSEASNFTDVQELIVLGPGDIAQAHKSDEWISLDQLNKGQQVYTNLLRRFCQNV